MDLVLSITVLCAFALLAGAFVLWRKGTHAKQAMLMAILAFVMIANVAIWVGPEPDPQGEPAAPASETGRQPR